MVPVALQRVSSILKAYTPRRLDIGLGGRAAVLMPILGEKEPFSFLLTRRTHKVETHKGQISFPGGVRDASDKDLLGTALRETREEIGLMSDGVHVLGEFDEYHSITGLVVTPFVGWIAAPFSLAPNPDEVEAILTVPFSVFQDSRLERVETRIRLGVKQEVYFYDFEGKEIWGLTARIIRDFLQLLKAATD
jgi:8-oxo-dGTP pyrophosphatase MutT (NUDIX family)